MSAHAEGGVPLKPYETPQPLNSTAPNGGCRRLQRLRATLRDLTASYSAVVDRTCLYRWVRLCEREPAAASVRRVSPAGAMCPSSWPRRRLAAAAAAAARH